MPYSAKGLGYKHTDTSYEAAEAAAPKAKKFHNAIILQLKTHGPMTADECAKRLGESVLSIRPRFSELFQKGIIRDTGRRHRNDSGRRAAVWEWVE